MRTSIIATAFLAACAQAIKITSPPKGQVLDLSEGFKVTFDTVNSDPTSAHIFIVNMANGNTPFSRDLGVVDLSKGFFVVTEDDIPAERAYQFNIQSIDKENTGILAQSEQFEVKPAEKKEPKPTSSASEYATTSSTSSHSLSSATVVSSSADATASADSDSSSSSTATSTFSTVSGSATATKNSGANASSTSVADSAAPSVVASGSLLALAVAGLVAVMA